MENLKFVELNEFYDKKWFELLNMVIDDPNYTKTQ